MALTAKIYINGEIGVDTSLTDVIRQFKSYSNPSEVEAIIDSVGGSVEQGQAIYSYLRNLGLPITTIAKKAYSIAATIYMAGDIRKIDDKPKALMIHLPIGTAEGNAEHFEYVAKEMRNIEKDFCEFYSKYTDIDKETVANLLAKETFMSGEEALEMGFATILQIPLKAVAKFTPKDLTTEKENETQMTKAESLIKAMASYFEPKQETEKEKETEIKSILTLQDAKGTEIVFPELEQGDTPSPRSEDKEGDKAEVDGKPAQGDYTNPEGGIWVFEAGELIEVKPAQEEEQEQEEDVDMEAFLKDLEAKMTTKIEAKFSKRNDDLNAEIKSLKKLIGSEDLDIKAKETKNRKSNKNTSYLR